MSLPVSRSKSSKIPWLLPGLHILGAALVVVSTGLFSAVHSPMGQWISTGESPGFAWIGVNINSLMGFVLVYSVFVCWLQINRARASRPSYRLLTFLICAEVVGIALVALLLFLQRTNLLPLILSVLLAVLLLQALIGLWRSDIVGTDRSLVLSPNYSANTGLFLVILFAMGAAISFLDPSWRRLSDQVLLDSDWEYKLRYLYPPVLSGAVTVWFGIAMMLIILGFRWLQVRINDRQSVYEAFNFLTFFSLVGAFTAFLLVTLYYAMLKIISMVVAGTVLLIVEPHFSFRAGTPSGFRRPAFILAVAGILGFFPFYTLLKYPEVKAVVLQYNELTRVDATFAREVANTLGLGKWIHIGQRPPQNNAPSPWPQPWRLDKTHPSLLPENFNLLVITVDALRGDAFHSAGYHRNLTPFLDRWAMEEALSFGRAYSQGGGSFAAYPFLVAGRSRFELYGPGLYEQNLYLKIAQAEGIQHYMLMKGFGPRDIYPPDMEVTELAISRAVSDRRSATADEVFESARKAIQVLPADERFLCFLTLMDVHNDLWKKEGGVDFGDRPKDLYDNNLSYLDRAFSRFISWLKEEGIYDRTVILFTSDHGEQFWEHGASLHGHTVYEEEIRIPLILVSHAIQKRFEDVPVIAADMAPTIADLAGYSVNPPYDDPRMGISLMPLTSGNEIERFLKRDVIGRASFKRRYFLYRNWEWKLVYLAELNLLQLFNVLNDPSEKNNLLDEEPRLAAELEQELLEYLETVEGKTYHSVLSKGDP